MTLDEAIIHAKEAAKRADLCEECRKEHSQLADWLEKLNWMKKEDTMQDNNYNIIEVTFKNGHSAVWEANKGDWDDYAYDGAAFIIKKGSAWVGIYNMDHVISVVVK